MQELFTTKSLTYLPKPNRNTLQLIKEFEQLQGVDRTEEQESRHRELLENEPVATEVRITVGTVSAFQQSRYQSYIRKARLWFEQEVGMPPADFLEDIPEDDPQYPYMFDMLTMSHAWAAILASVKKYETRSHPLLTGNTKDEWVEHPIPSEWNTVPTFLDSVPSDLLWSLNALANEVNPNLWHVPGDETSKKFGVMSVS